MIRILAFLSSGVSRPSPNSFARRFRIWAVDIQASSEATAKGGALPETIPVDTTYGVGFKGRGPSLVALSVQPSTFSGVGGFRLCTGHGRGRRRRCALLRPILSTIR